MKPFFFSILFFSSLISFHTTFAQSSLKDTILYSYPVKYKRSEMNPMDMALFPFSLIRFNKKAVILVSKNYLTVKSAKQDSLIFASFKLDSISIKKKKIHKMKNETSVFLLSKNLIVPNWSVLNIPSNPNSVFFLIDKEQIEKLEHYLKL